MQQRNIDGYVETSWNLKGRKPYFLSCGMVCLRSITESSDNSLCMSPLSPFLMFLESCEGIAFLIFNMAENSDFFQEFSCILIEFLVTLKDTIR